MKKKIIAIIMALTMTTSLVACGGGNGTADTKQEKPKTEASVSEKNTKDTDKKDDTEKEDSKKKETEKEKAEAEKESEKKIASVDTKKETTKTENKDNNTQKPNTGNNNSSKPSNQSNNTSNNNKPTPKPEQPSKPAEKPSEPQKPAPHVHNYNTVVSSTNGDCSHVGKVTKKCSCGATVTENGSYGDHSWQDQYKEVHHDAKYENRPVYKWVAYDKCRKCGYETEHKTGDIIDHVLECDGTYTTFEKQVQTGTESVQVEKPWTERVPDGKKCTICGTHKH